MPESEAIKYCSFTNPMHVLGFLSNSDCHDGRFILPVAVGALVYHELRRHISPSDADHSIEHFNVGNAAAAAMSQLGC